MTTTNSLNNLNKNNKEVDVMTKKAATTNKNNVKGGMVMNKNNKGGVNMVEVLNSLERIVKYNKGKFYSQKQMKFMRANSISPKLLEKEGINLMPGTFFVGVKNDEGFICGYICTDAGVIAKVKVKGETIKDNAPNESNKRKEDDSVKYSKKEFEVKLFNREVKASITFTSNNSKYLTGTVEYTNKEGEQDKIIFRWNRRKHQVPQVILNGKKVSGGKARALQALVITLINKYVKDVEEDEVLKEAALTKPESKTKDEPQDNKESINSTTNNTIPKFNTGNPASEKELFK